MRNDMAGPMSLRGWLLVDVAMGLSSGLLLLMASAPLARWVGLPAPVLFWIGVVLLGYVLLLLVAARRDAALGWTGLVLAANVGWVVLSVAVLLSGSVAPSALGQGIIVAQAVLVAWLTWMEWRALLRLPPVTRAQAASAA